MRLLVSVSTPDEAIAALAGGADIVDVKDPAEGALGAVGPATLRAIRAVVTPPALLSAALGDAPRLPGTLVLAAAAAACPVDYVKVGLLTVRDERAALRLLRAVRAATQEVGPRTEAAGPRPGLGVVAVAYADAERVGAFPPARLPALARRAGLHGVLLDTAVKDGTTAIEALGQSGVARVLADARALDLLAGLAGALRLEDLPRAAELGADLVGVRGAACEGGRLGRVSAEKVSALREALGLEAVPAPTG